MTKLIQVPTKVLTQRHPFSQLDRCLTDTPQAHYTRMQRIKGKKLATKEELYRRVRLGRDYLARHWQRPVLMQEVAQESSLSQFHFQRTFSAVFGISPARFACLVKIKKAHDLLRSGQYNVKQVAVKLGYADGFSFSKAFKREVGVAPCCFLR